MSQARFEELVAEITKAIGDKPLDDALGDFLNQNYPADGEAYRDMAASLGEGEGEGWVCGREAAGIRYGRIVKPGGITGVFSTDVVRMENVKGPHHIHPTGEIGWIIPVSGTPTLDGMGKGWYVYPPMSDHWPTVEGGDTYVLYFLPNGEMEFTGK